MSKMEHSFSNVPAVKFDRSIFNRDHGYKTAFGPDYLIPFLCEEILPGDTVKLSATHLIRITNSLIRPFLDNMYLDTFYFWCPNRLLFANWKKLMGEQVNPGDSISQALPVMTAYSPAVESLSDYFGIPIADAASPIGAAGTISGIQSLPFRMYNFIWNEHFRDQNLQNSVTFSTGDGPDAIANYVLLKRGKRHDYFTSCLPFLQKGTALSLPLGGQAPITGIGKWTTNWSAGPVTFYETDKPAGTSYANYKVAGAAGDDQFGFLKGSDGTPDIYADLSLATGATLNQFRLNVQIQEMLERDARGGTRYNEICQSHFGVIYPDLLYKPEFLGGRSVPLQVAMVPQTSAANAQPTGLGNLAAFGAGLSQGSGFVKSFVEHGWIMGIMMVRADLSYQQGLHKKWVRSTRYDHYDPALAHLGEQAVLNQEIYCQGSANPAQDAATFGYQERWSEYRYANSLITGKLRSSYSTPLDSWHLAQKFTSLPTLGDTFIKETMPISRVAAVTSEPYFVADIAFDFKHARVMPVYSVPGLSSSRI